MISLEQVMNNSEIGYARHKIITDETGRPVDYCYLAVNKAFETMTGLKGKSLINHTVTEVLPKTLEDDFDWIGYYGAIAKDGRKRVMEQYSYALEKWFRIEAFSCESGCFTTLFSDITHERELTEASKTFLDDREGMNTYEQITRRMKRISGASYVALNLLMEESGHFKTVSIAGVPAFIQKATQLAGFSLLNNEWESIPQVYDRFKDKRVIQFDQLHEMMDPIISKTTVRLFEKTFNLGKTFMIKIVQQDQVIGDFTLIFTKDLDNQENGPLKHETQVVVYADMVAMLFGKRRRQQELEERKNQLQESKRLYQSVAEDTPAMICRFDPDMNITYINRAYSDYFEKEASSLVGSSFLDLIPRQQQDAIRSVLDRLTPESPSITTEHQVHTADNKALRWHRWTNRALFDKEGRIVSYQSVGLDITQQRQTQKALEAANERLLTVINSLDSTIYISDMDTYEILLINEHARQRWGDIVGTKCWQTMRTDQAEPCTFCPNSKLLDATGKPTGIVRWEHFNAIDERWYDCWDQAIEWIDGRTVHMALASDMTERKETEVALQKVKDDLQNISDHMLDLVAVTDLQGRYRFVGASYKITGYKQEDLIGRNIIEFVNPVDLSKVQAQFDELVSQKVKTGRSTYRFRCADGTYLWCETYGTLILDKQGKPLEVLLNTRDITQQRRLEQDIRESEQRFRALFETMAQGVVYQDKDGNITAANSAAERILGMSLDQMQGKTSLDPAWRAVHEDGQPYLGNNHPAMVALQTGQPVFGETMGVYNSQEQKYHWIKVNAVPQFHEGGERPYQVYATFEDITKELETNQLLKNNQSQLERVLMETGKQKSHVEAMHEIAVDVLNSTAFLETATKLFNDCKRLTGATSGYVALLNEAGDENEVIYLDSGGDTCTVDPELPMPIRGLRGITYHSGEVEYHNDFMHSPYWSLMPHGHVGLNNVLFAPLKNEEKVVGLLGLGNKAGGFTDEDAKTAKTVAKFCSIALQKSRLITQLTQEKEKAVDANRAKSTFLANMSHELRTPLNGIIGFSEILKNTELNHDQQGFVDTVHSSAMHLSDVITDILDFSRIEAGKFELHPENTSLKELVEKTISIISQKARQKGLALNLSYGEQLPQTVFVDGPRLRQILLNLLSNAVKFTDSGSVHLTIKLLQRHSDSALLLFRVDDTGRGIKQEDQTRVFEPFHQTDMSSSKSAEGTGLGLAIIKEILEKMDSTLKLQSVYGEGSTFSFELLVSCEPSQTTGTNQTFAERTEDQSSFKYKKVLIVEDNTVNMNYAQTILSMFSKDIQILMAKDGNEAYHVFLEHAPDLILMDIVMPGVDGYQATAMIRQHDEQVPIIAMTAKALKEDREICLAAGMNDYITKPVSVYQFKETLKKYLGPSE